MERYEKYKDSGVEWIGKIPEGWEEIKLKCLSLKRTISSIGSQKIAKDLSNGRTLLWANRNERKKMLDSFSRKLIPA